MSEILVKSALVKEKKCTPVCLSPHFSAFLQESGVRELQHTNLHIGAETLDHEAGNSLFLYISLSTLGSCERCI